MGILPHLVEDRERNCEEDIHLRRPEDKVRPEDTEAGCHPKKKNNKMCYDDDVKELVNVNKINYIIKREGEN